MTILLALPVFPVSENSEVVLIYPAYMAIKIYPTKVRSKQQREMPRLPRLECHRSGPEADFILGNCRVADS